MKRIAAFIYFFAAFVMLFSTSVLAYIDPSAVNYIIQLVAGAVIVVGAGIGFYFRKIRRALKKKKTEEVEYEDEDDEE